MSQSKGIKLVGVPQSKPLHGFSPNFQGMFIPRGSRADYVFGGYPVITVATATLFKIFQVLKFVGVPQTKPLHGFSPNFQDLFIPRRSRADYDFGGYPVITVAIATLFKIFWP